MAETDTPISEIATKVDAPASPPPVEVKPVVAPATAKVAAKPQPAQAPAQAATPQAPVPAPAAVAVKAAAKPLQPAKPAPKPVAKKPVVAVARKPAAKTAKPAVRKPVTTPTSAAPVRTAPKAKEAKMTTDKTQAIFADINDRTKGAIEKSTQLFEDVSAFNKGNIEAIVESSKIAAKNIETIGQDAADYAKTSFESATAAVKTLASVKSPTEFLKLQGDYARTAFDTLIAESSRSTEKMLKMFGEIAQPISNRVSVATEKMKIVA